jgi:hypothetical protein
MNGLRRAALICGVLAGMIGLAVFGFVLFAPLGTSVSTNCVGVGEGTQRCTFVTTYTSVVQNQGLASVLGVLIVGIAIFAAILIGSLLEARNPNSGGRLLLWWGTLLLTIGIVFAISIGIWLLPSWGLAIAASVLCLVNVADRRPGTV